MAAKRRRDAGGGQKKPERAAIMYKFMLGLARIMAILGGIMLVALIALTCASIAGRLINGGLHSDLVQGLVPGLAGWLLDLGVGPVNGDFELVEAGVAFSIFAFLPLCQITSGHASVDIFTGALPRRLNRALGMVIELVFAAVLVLITAILAVDGYSVNDKIVVFDRVRELFRSTRKLDTLEVLNKAVNSTLSRTIMTSLTTLLTVVALFLFGGPTLQGFSLALIVGIVVGTLSSIFFACPVLLKLGVTKQDLLPKARDDAELARRP